MNTHTQPCEYAECNCQVTGGRGGRGLLQRRLPERDSTDEEMELVCACGHPPCDAE